MIQVTATMRILVAIEPVDLRKGIDGLAQLCHDKLASDPFSGLSVATIWSRSAGDVDVNVTYWCECVVRGHELSSGGKPLAVSGVPFPKGATSRVKDTAHLHCAGGH